MKKISKILIVSSIILFPFFVNASTITYMAGSDTLSSSRTVINNDFASLNRTKLESGTTTPSLSIGQLTIGYLTATSSTDSSIKSDLLIYGGDLYLGSGTATTTLTSSSGNLSISGTSVLAGFISNASSTISSSLLVNGDLNSSSTASFNNLQLATPLPVLSGGMGLNSYTKNQLIYASGATTLGQIATSSLGLVTTNVAEGTNLYYTDLRVASVIAGTSTDALPQGSTNLYWSNLLWAGQLTGTTTDALPQGLVNFYASQTRFDNLLSATNTVNSLNSAPNLTTVGTLGSLTVSGHTSLQSASTSQITMNSFIASASSTIAGQLNTDVIINRGNATTTRLCFEAGGCMDSPEVVGSNIALFHHNSSAEIAGYEKLFTYPDSVDINIDESCSADADTAGGYCLIDSYVSTTTDMAIIEIPSGVWRYRYYTYTSNALVGNSKIEATIYIRDIAGNEVQLGQATSSAITKTSVVETLFSYTQANATSTNITDRVVIKIRGWTDSSLARDVHFLYGGDSTNYSHVITPITVGNFNFARKDRNETITGNWTFGGTLSVTGNSTLTYASTTGMTGLYASSTLGYFGTLYLPNIGTAAGTFLAVDASGKVIATSTPSGATGITSLNTLTGASQTFAATNGLLSINSVGTVHNLNASTSPYYGNITATGTVAFTSNLGVTGLSTLTGGFLSTASSTISNTLQVSGTTIFGGLSTLNTGFIAVGSSTIANNLTVTGITILPGLHLQPAFSYATSTAWSGTTTLALGPAYYLEIWSGIQCFTDIGTLDVMISDGTNKMNWLNASTTVGTVALNSNNTFTASEKRYAEVGNPATAPTKISCTVDKVVIQ